MLFRQPMSKSPEVMRTEDRGQSTSLASDVHRRALYRYLVKFVLTSTLVFIDLAYDHLPLNTNFCFRFESVRQVGRYFYYFRRICVLFHMVLYMKFAFVRIRSDFNLAGFFRCFVLEFFISPLKKKSESLLNTLRDVANHRCVRSFSCRLSGCQLNNQW